jgi:hypothetical protein
MDEMVHRWYHAKRRVFSADLQVCATQQESREAADQHPGKTQSSKDMLTPVQLGHVCDMKLRRLSWVVVPGNQSKPFTGFLLLFV